MPTLQWVGKDKVVNHHLDVPFRVLNKVSDRHEHTIIDYVAFDAVSVSAVPEPLSLRMMLAGLLLIGTAAARQRG